MPIDDADVRDGPRVPNDDASVNDFDPASEETLGGEATSGSQGGGTTADVPEEDDPAIVETEQQPT